MIKELRDLIDEIKKQAGSSPLTEDKKKILEKEFAYFQKNVESSVSNILSARILSTPQENKFAEKLKVFLEKTGKKYKGNNLS